MKICSRCGKEKSLEGFYRDGRASDQRQSACKKCCNAQSRDYYERHPEVHRKSCREYNKRNRRKIEERSQRRRASDPEFKILTNLRRRIIHALHGRNKSESTRKLLGCPVGFFKLHLEKQFKPGMTWENYGSVWEVDHIMPCSRFDMSDPLQQHLCFHYTNTQPLFAEENRYKHNKIIP